MAQFNPFKSLMEVDRYIAGQEASRRQEAQQNALMEMQAQQRAQQYASPKAFAPVPMVNETGDITMGVPTFTPATGSAGIQPLQPLEGYSFIRETPEEKRQKELLVKQREAQIETETARKKEQEKVTGKQIAERLSGQINTAYESSSAVPIIKRSLDILNTLETGGIDAVRLKAKQFLGVESGDEAELTQNLSKAVLKQLKPTFGAQFTKAEGDFLKSIEAGLGKSTAGNKRILRRALQVYERGIRRGMDAAQKQGEMDTYNELKSALEYTVPVQENKQTGIKFIGFE